MYRTGVRNRVGLPRDLLGDATPNLQALAREGAVRPLRPILPAVTCSVQSTFTTGLLPRGHGCVANGWYFRDLSEVWLSENLLGRLLAGGGGARLLRRIGRWRGGKLFWWYN